jgi:hypothetical protein
MDLWGEAVCGLQALEMRQAQSFALRQPKPRVLETDRDFREDVKIEGTNPRSPLESTKVSKKRTQTKSERSGKPGREHAK